MFNVNNQPSTFKFTAPLEKHGQQPVSSTSLRFTLALHAGILAAFHAGLRSVLYRAAVAGEQPELPAEHPDGLTKLAMPKLAPLVIEDEMPGYKLAMTAGLEASDVQQFEDVKLSNFNLEPLNGGTVKVQVSAHFHPTPEQVKWIYEQQGREVQITLTPPLPGTVEASPQGTLAGFGEGGPQPYLVTALEIDENKARHEITVTATFEDDDVAKVGPWAYVPSLEEVGIALFKEIDAPVEFSDDVRASWKTEQAAA